MSARLCLVVLLAAIARGSADADTSAPAPAPSTEPQLAQLAQQARPQPPFRTEQEWVVASVAEHVWRVTHLETARTGPPGLRVTLSASGPLPTFAVTHGGGATLMVPVVAHIFSAETARPLVMALAPDVVSVPPSGESQAAAVAASLELLDRLTAPSLRVILDEDRRVSAALRAAPRSAGLHEQAAMLTAAVALREGAGVLSDIRPVLSRIAAHLAVADVSRGARPQTAAGEVARAIVLALVGREREAVAAAAALATPRRSIVERVWSRVVFMRATADWRHLPEPRQGLVVERLAYAGALKQRLGAHRMFDGLTRDDAFDGPDWTRLALSGTYTVAIANTMSDAALALELDEARRTLAEYRGVTATGDAVVGALVTAGPGTADPYRVLDWRLWRDSALRHLSARVASSIWHLQMLGMDGNARTASLSKSFRQLPTLPLALALTGTEPADLQPVMSDIAAVVAARPADLPPAAWNALEKKAATARVAWPAEDDWFAPWVLPGTAMALIDRSLQPGCRRPATIAELERFHDMAPSDWWAAYSLAWRRVPGKPTMASVEAHAGPLMAFDMNTLQHMFDYVPGAVGDYERLARAMCGLDKDKCDRLGDQLLASGREREAAAAYDDWFVAASDRVRASQGVSWLVHYYLDTDRKERATQIATETAEVGSAGGLEVLADLLERTGRREEAFALYTRLMERYTGWTTPLGLYHLRQWRTSGDIAEQRRGEALLKDRFPRGLEPVLLEALPPLPSDGVRFVTFGSRPARAGLQPDDVIVAVDGFRARTYRQYWVLARLSRESTMDVVVWRAGRYVPLRLPLPQRYMGVGMNDYTPPARRSER